MPGSVSPSGPVSAATGWDLSALPSGAAVVSAVARYHAEVTPSAASFRVVDPFGSHTATFSPEQFPVDVNVDWAVPGLVALQVNAGNSNYTPGSAAYTVTTANPGVFSGATGMCDSLTITYTTLGTLRILVQDTCTIGGIGPVAGALVTLSTGAQATTGSDGIAEFTDLTVGSYTWVAQASGYNLSPVGSQSVAAGVNSATTTITPSGGCKGRLTVRALNTCDGTPVAGALVTVSPGDLTATTDADGYASFELTPRDGLDPITYTYTVSKTGYDSGSGSSTISSGVTTSRTGSLHPTAGCDGELSLEVDGFCTRAAEEGVSVYLDGVLLGTTDSEGQLAAEALAILTAGLHTLLLTKGGFQSVTVTLDLTADDVASGYYAQLLYVTPNGGCGSSGVGSGGGEGGTGGVSSPRACETASGGVSAPNGCE